MEWLIISTVEDFIRGVDLVTWLRAWYGIALLLWIVMMSMTAQYWITAFSHRDQFLPFVWSHMWIGTIAVLECGFYTWVIWSSPEHILWRKAAVMMLPVMISIQALAFGIFGNLIFWGPGGVIARKRSRKQNSNTAA